MGTTVRTSISFCMAAVTGLTFGLLLAGAALFLAHGSGLDRTTASTPQERVSPSAPVGVFSRSVTP